MSAVPDLHINKMAIVIGGTLQQHRDVDFLFMKSAPCDSSEKWWCVFHPRSLYSVENQVFGSYPSSVKIYEEFIGL